MPLPSLLACPGCSRHIRSTERACPFCQSAVVFGVPPARVLPRRRLSRAALAFGASTLAVATLSCGGVSGTGIDDEAGLAEGATDGARDAAHDGHCMSAALYGGFPGEQPCFEEPDAAAREGSPDDGPDDATTPPSDAEFPPNYCDVISHAAYGAPPPQCQ